MGSHPFGPPQLGLYGAKAAEDGTKRRRICVSHEVPRSPGQGPVAVCAAVSVGSQVGAQGPMRSSVLGQALLRAQGDIASASVHGSGMVAGYTGAVSRLAAEISDISAQRSLLGEAVGAEDRLLLKRRRVFVNPGLEQPCSQGALDALAACRGVEVASAVAAWPSGPKDQAAEVVAAAAVGHRAPASSPFGGPWSIAWWPWARPSGVCLAAGSGGLLPLRPAARIAQPGLSRGVARG